MNGLELCAPGWDNRGVGADAKGRHGDADRGEIILAERSEIFVGKLLDGREVLGLMLCGERTLVTGMTRGTLGGHTLVITTDGLHLASEVGQDLFESDEGVLLGRVGWAQVDGLGSGLYRTSQLSRWELSSRSSQPLRISSSKSQKFFTLSSEQEHHDRTTFQAAFGSSPPL